MAEREIDLFRYNRIDGKWTLNADELAAKFWASKWSDVDQYPWPIERRLTTFIAVAEDEEGLQSTLDPALDLNEVLSLVIDRRPVTS